jgi:hypothetical protein
VSSTVDANVLLYASDRTSEHQTKALAFIERWADGPDLVYLFWPTVMSYLRISTHPRIFEDPLAPNVAEMNIATILSMPHVRTGAEDERFWGTWREATRGVVVRGNLVPDAHLVALMRQHGVTEIWSRDTDLRKFEGIRLRDPFEA